jgi:hypothetical protein
MLVIVTGLSAIVGMRHSHSTPAPPDWIQRRRPAARNSSFVGAPNRPSASAMCAATSARVVAMMKRVTGKSRCSPASRSGVTRASLIRIVAIVSPPPGVLLAARCHRTAATGRGPPNALS